MGMQVYPAPGQKQVAARSRVTLTPGYMPVVRVAALPSGLRQTSGVPDGAGGSVEVTFTWDNGIDTATRTVSIEIPASEHANYAQPDGDGEGWSEVLEFDLGPIAPDGFFSDLSECAKWGEGVTLDTVVCFVESPRVLDCAVQEAPTQYAHEQDDAGAFTTPCLTDGAGVPLGKYPAEFPVQQLVEVADCTGGPLQALDVTARQVRKLGPCFVTWSAWDEATALVTGTEAAPVSFTTATLTNLFDGVTTAHSQARRGWSGASGGTARRHNTAGGHQVLRDVVGVVEVVLRVYARIAGATTGRVVLQAGPESRIETRVTSTTYGWVTQRGTLRCGIAADDPVTWQMYGALLSAGGGLRLDVLYVVVEYLAVG
ncbi:hypothetical protein OV203_02405 [Nannocystis sp. ILAH1]|uniref:hypothetical protein n=1 Tax=Nannocystis sp. ILAH1 TaxID=2996789 RepID=UPI0022719C26|nr:hypothetical protein [Nannocystis sp. ILAH1]MCY0985963.1 hypothetical protein [Nannocystis sp. ILAH1]